MALNAALAEALAIHDINATPEQTTARSGAKRCDVQIRRRHGDRYFTALECKIGHDVAQRGNAVKDAQRWLKQSDCWNALALCYPEEMSEPTQRTLRQILETTDNLLMVKVSHGGAVGQWHKGGLADLATLSDDIGENETYAITDIMRSAIVAASELIDVDTGKDLAAALELPWDPTEQQQTDPRPARIACLIIANMALLQNRMHSEGMRLPGLDALITLRSVPNTQVSLLDNWRRIREVDYAPVVDPALAVLHTLPTNHHTDSLLKDLIEAVLDCVPRIRGLQLDHAGPLYHGLLQTARYDGSFYTSTSAAVLLAELAMPLNWLPSQSDWADVDRLSCLKICDPACGTGTLLMAAARTIQERYRAAGGNADNFEALHLALIEDTLHGLDINRHAIHLAACMLTVSAPKIDYNRMNLYNMQHGVNSKGEVRAGSLDLLVNNAAYLPGLAPDTSQRRAAAEGYEEDGPPVLEGACDLVIMNPPFTRNDIRNLCLPREDRKKVQKHEVELAKNTKDEAHSKAINQSSIRTFFTPIADMLLNARGTLAIVIPSTACTGTSGKYERNLLTDPKRFHLDMVITSHDNSRIYFSENTNIHESLIIARRPTPETSGNPTAFISLATNPTSASEAHYLAGAIQQALEGDSGFLSNYGTIGWRSLEQLRDRPWNTACFYDQTLSEVWDQLTDNPALVPIGTVAAVEPEGRRIRDAFTKAQRRQSPDMRALWAQKSARQQTMRTSPDEFVVSKKGMRDYAAKLWEKRSHLLLANRTRLNLTRTPAVFLDTPALGSAFTPALPYGEARETLCKAWCVWLNSTFGVVAFLNIRQKNLTYPHFSLDGLRSLPVPRTDQCDVRTLANAYEEFAKKPLLPLPKMHDDPIRRALDDAILAAVPGLARNNYRHVPAVDLVGAKCKQRDRTVSLKVGVGRLLLPACGSGVIGDLVAPLGGEVGAGRSALLAAGVLGLVDHEAKLTALFHAAVEAGDWRFSVSLVREIRALMELLGRVGEALPRPVEPSEYLQHGFAWLDGEELRDTVPLETAEDLAEHHGFVTWKRPALVGPEPEPADVVEDAVVDAADVEADPDEPLTMPDGTTYHPRGAAHAG